MKFSKEKPTTTEPTTLTLALNVGQLLEEIAANERTVARLAPEEGRINTRISNLQDDRARLRGLSPYEDELLPEMRRQIAAIDAELPTLKRRLAEIAPPVQSSYKRAIELRGALLSEKQAAVTRAVELAATTAPSRDRLAGERLKLDGLRKRLAGAESDLEKARTFVQLKNERESKVSTLLELGTIPRSAPTSSPEEMRRAAEDVEIIKQAIYLQEQIVGDLRGNFVTEIRSALAEVRNGLIQRVANAFREAVEAESTGRMLQGAVSRESGGGGLAAFEFWGIPLPSNGDYGQFGAWLNEMRQGGAEV